MIRMINLDKKFIVPVDDFEVIKKLFFIKKNQNFLKKNEFYSLKDINIEINYGEKIFVIGKSGSGKTTLFSILSDKIDFDRGRLEKSNNLFASTLINLPPNLFPRLNLKNFIKMIISFFSKNQEKNSKNIIKEIIDLLKISQNDLSGNFYEKDKSIYKLIVLAIASYEKNKIYLFDNFNFKFESEIFENIWKKFKENTKFQTHIIFSCNNVNFIKKNADKILLLDNGNVKKFDFVKKFNDSEIEDAIKNEQNDDFIDDDENV